MEEIIRNIENIRRIKRAHSFALLCKKRVLGVGIGQKEVQGKPTEAMSITILVEEKIKESLVPVQDKLPSELDGIATDVISISEDDPLVKVRLRQSQMLEDNRTKRWRPAPRGVSIGHYLLQGAGTLGAWIKDKITGEPLLLSCWHIIANMGNCRKGDPILQPAVLDGGKMPDDTIAYLDRWIDVEMIVPTLSLDDAKQRLKDMVDSKLKVPTNKVDAAVAKPISDAVVSEEILGIGEIRGTINGEIGMCVVKSGRTTGLIKGKINLIDVDIFVKYPTGIALFIGQLVAK